MFKSVTFGRWTFALDTNKRIVGVGLQFALWQSEIELSLALPFVWLSVTYARIVY